MTLYAKWKRETVKVITEETDKEDEGEKVSNGKAPLILDPDDVKKSADDNNQQAGILADEAIPIWSIALIIAGGALLLSGLAVLLIIIIKKKKRKAGN